MKYTLIEYLTNEGYNKDDAEKLIRAGQVMVNRMVVFTPSVRLKGSETIDINLKSKWVSRGALKLLKAIDVFSLDFSDKVVLDIGSSTGGFSQVALEHGAKHVYSLDIGTNQLDYKIRSNPKVTTMEKTNLKSINKDMFKKEIDIVVTDVSFISLKEVFKVLKHLDTIEIIMALIKPQYEANSNQVQKGGFIPKELHKDIINKVKTYAKDNGFKIIKVEESGILGKESKNIEYISKIKRI